MEDDPSASVKALVESIKPLQQLLENGILSKPLGESFEGMETMQQANSSVTLAYAIYDLLWSTPCLAQAGSQLRRKQST